MSPAAGPIRTPAVLRAIRAPELERFLSRQNIDLVVTDQVEAIKVRVAKGIEVFERKARDGIQAGRKRAVLLATTLVVGVSLAAAHALLLAGGRLTEKGGREFFLSLIAAVALLIGLIAGTRLVSVISDVRRLSRLAGSRAADLEAARTPEQVLDLAETVLEEARALGAVPPQE